MRALLGTGLCAHRCANVSAHNQDEDSKGREIKVASEDVRAVAYISREVKCCIVARRGADVADTHTHTHHPLRLLFYAVQLRRSTDSGAEHHGPYSVLQRALSARVAEHSSGPSSQQVRSENELPTDGAAHTPSPEPQQRRSASTPLRLHARKAAPLTARRRGRRCTRVLVCGQLEIRNSSTTPLVAEAGEVRKHKNEKTAL